MIRRLLSTAIAATFVLGLAGAFPASAQDTEEARAEVATFLAGHGIAVEGGVEALSDEQVLEIMNVINSDASDAEKQEQIAVIVGS